VGEPDSETVLPDVRDGLTAAARRLLVALCERRLRTPGYVKSARVVDAAARVAGRTGAGRIVYAELVAMVQDFSARYPLVDGQGNFGSIDSGRASAARYTEARLAALGLELLHGVGDEREDFVAGARRDELAVLPARFPNLLVNGAPSGVPPHNLREVIDATIAYINNPAIGTGELLGHLRGPDFPTGAIVDATGLRDAYECGRGQLRVRGRAHVAPGRRSYRSQTSVDPDSGALVHGYGPDDDGPDWARSLVVTELPFGVTKLGRGGVVAEIRRLAKTKQITGIVDVEDHSIEQLGMQVVIELKRDADPDKVLDALYTRTQLQRTIPMQLAALVDGLPQTIGLRDAIKHYVTHRHAVLAQLTGETSTPRIRELIVSDLRDLAGRYGDERRTTIS
jgi:DNA gyrase subunit A